MLKQRAAIRAATIALMVTAGADAAHSAEWLLSCSGTRKDIANDFQVEQVPGFLISLDWDADKLVLQDAPELPTLVVTIARPDFIEARGFFLDGATPKEIRFTSHLGSPGPADWKTYIVATRPGDLNRMTAATKTRASGTVQLLTYSQLDLICRVEHVSP
jgi:hypothetical protein